MEMEGFLFSTSTRAVSRIGLALLFTSGLLPAGIHFELQDIQGGTHSQEEWTKAKAVVIFFVTTDCPLSNTLAPEMNRLQQEYTKRGMQFYAVQGDSTVPPEEVRKHSLEFEYRFPVLLDPKQVLASKTGATVTPEVAVISAAGELLYRGRIDNRVERIGVTRFQPTTFDLRDALDALLAGRPVPHRLTHAIGCSITNSK